jgi:hypothetical protein
LIILSFLIFYGLTYETYQTENAVHTVFRYPQKQEKTSR